MGNIWAVFRFEWRRALTVPRMAWWCFLVAFPIGISTLVRTVPGDVPREPWSLFLFALLPMLVSVLGMFLWTAPAVSAELERESWIYLAIRPGGRTAVLLGKYLAALCWTLPAALLSMTICVFIASPEMSRFSVSGTVDGSPGLILWFTLARLICFSCPAYGAVYLLLGTIFTKRSMVIAVIYTLIFELAVAMVPAIINKFTIQFRLRALLISWGQITVDDNGGLISTELIGDSPPSVHVWVLLGYTTILLLAALWIIRRREYAASAAAEA